jgi:hypothetical protein
MTNPRVIVMLPSVTFLEDGTTELGWQVSPATIDVEGGDTTYDFLKSIIPGTLQIHQLADGTDLWHDDEYLYTYADQPNPIASIMAGFRVNGPVVLARTDDMGNTIGFSDHEGPRLLAEIQEIITLLETSEALALRAAFQHLNN